MIIAEKNQQSSSTEEETNDIKQLSNSDESKTKLNVKEKKEITENNSLNYFEETKSLKYDSSYKAVLSDNKIISLENLQHYLLIFPKMKQALIIYLHKKVVKITPVPLLRILGEKDFTQRL